MELCYLKVRAIYETKEELEEKFIPWRWPRLLPAHDHVSLGLSLKPFVHAAAVSKFALAQQSLWHSCCSCCSDRWSGLQFFCSQDDPRSGLWSIHSFVKPLQGARSHMSLNSVVCLQPHLRLQACPSFYCTWQSIWALIGLTDKLVIKCAIVLTCQVVKAAAFGPLLCMSPCNLLHRDRMDGELSSLLFACSVKGSTNPAVSTALAPRLFLCCLPEGNSRKHLNKVHSSTRVWATPGSKSVRCVTVRLTFFKNSSPC